MQCDAPGGEGVAIGDLMRIMVPRVGILTSIHGPTLGLF